MLHQAHFSSFLLRPCHRPLARLVIVLTRLVATRLVKVRVEDVLLLCSVSAAPPHDSQHTLGDELDVTDLFGKDLGLVGDFRKLDVLASEKLGHAGDV